MHLIIEPYKAVGTVQFGMTAAEVRESIGKPFRSFKRTPMAKMPMDCFSSEGIFAYYHESGLCNAIEIASPSSVALDGRLLIDQPFPAVYPWLELSDPAVFDISAGITAPKYGISLYVSPEDSDGIASVISVTAFDRDYLRKA